MLKEEKQKVAEALYEAEKTQKWIPKISATYPDMTLEDAYEIQSIGIAKRLEDGKTIIGKKIGLTSKGMQQQLNVTVPDYGILLNSMMVNEGTPCKMEELISPRIEGELAFILKEPLRGPGVTVADVFNATGWIVPCFEVCDTRVANWDVTVLDTISDNAGGSRFIIGGSPKKIEDINLRFVGMTIEKNGEMVNSATGAEVMGNPAAAVAWLANKMGEYGTTLEAGEIILSGAFMSAIPAVAGDCFTVYVDGFPAVSTRFE